MGRNIGLKQFIAEAEEAWFKVFYSGRVTRLLSRDGAPLATLPKELDSRCKILYFFEGFWGPRIAGQMLRNMPLAVREGRLYVIRYDPGPLSAKVCSVRLLCHSKNREVVKTTLQGGPEGRVYVLHVLTKGPDGKPVIRLRLGPRYDFRYYPPLVSRTRRRRLKALKPNCH